MHKITVLVTGGAGYIGSGCVAELVKAGHSVVCFDNLSAGTRSMIVPGAIFVLGDITDSSALRSVFSKYQFDVVIHCAGKKAVGESEKNPAVYFDTNVTGTLNVLTIMAEFSVPRIIFSSTAAVYQSSKNPLIESNILAPVSVYGVSKLMAETLIQEFVRTSKIQSSCIFRYFNVAGDAGLVYEDKRPQNVFPLIAQAILKGEKFPILGNDYETPDGTGVRDYVHVRDIISAHLLAISLESSNIYNLGTGTGYSVLSLMTAFETALSKPVAVEYLPRRAGDVAIAVANSTLAQTILRWTPQYFLTEMVDDTITIYGR